MSAGRMNDNTTIRAGSSLSRHNVLPQPAQASLTNGDSAALAFSASIGHPNMIQRHLPRTFQARRATWC